MKIRRRVALGLVAMQFLSPVYSVAAVRYRMGITHIGAVPQQDEASYRMLERRFQRWLENLPSVNIGAEAVPSTTPHLADDEGETRQSGLLRQAAEEWKLGRRENSQKLVRRALALHPDGAAPNFEPWDQDSETFSAVAFEREVDEQRRRTRRICEVELRGPIGDVRVNGFEVGARRTFQLAAGEHRITAAVDGQPRERSFLCERQGRTRLSIGDAPLKTAAPSLESIRRRHQLSSLFLLKPDGGRYTLMLYTPGLALEEIPTSQPILADTAIGAEARPLPVATDAFLQLFERHRTQSTLALADTSAWAENRLHEPPASQWYNNWKFWTILGGAATAVAVSYFATRQDSVKTQGGWVSVNLD